MLLVILVHAVFSTLTGAKKNCLESQAPNVINKFRKILQRFIFLCHYVHRDLLVKSEVRILFCNYVTRKCNS